MKFLSEPRIALASAALLASLGVSIANTALPAIAHSFSSSFSAARWVIVAYLLAVTISVTLAGCLGDIFGRRAVFFAGVALFAASSLFCALSPNLAMLVIFRIFQGIGGAAAITLSQALVTEAVPASRIGGTMGLLGTTSAVGTAIGPSLGGFLIAGAGWRAAFFFLFASGTAASILSVRNLSSSVQPGKRPPVALLRPYALQSRAVLASLAMNSLVSTVMMSTLVIGPFYLSQSLGLGLGEVGLVMSLGPCLSILSGFPAGRMVDKVGARAIVSLGLSFMTIGTLGLALLPPRFGVPGFAISVAFLSPGYQLFLAANGTSVMTASDPEERGVVAGLLNLSRNLGLLAGASLMGAVYAAAGLPCTFLLATAITLSALAISFLRKSALTSS